ncbi:Counting factor 60 [Zalerion maritima]|uniref:Counting factor 60 n=1 Tax=Zalerion maritima TaxID=339359 RepID=A0AAD5WQS8_9PEZI|nr:Counting factor 60 [Zalerion maritima]
MLLHPRSLGIRALYLVLAVGFILFLIHNTSDVMWAPKASTVVSATTAAVGANGIDLSWHPPSSSSLNNLDSVMGSSGVYGFIYNSSVTPDEKYGTYNWCNMPHVRKTEYPVPSPSDGYSLKFVEVIHRHHKRTPYASNAFPVEPYRWDCDDQALYKYGAPLESSGSDHVDGAAAVYWKGYSSPTNPFTPQGWIGNCSFPQITAQGLDDSWTHGNDIYGVYHDLLGFLPSRDSGSSTSDPSSPSRNEAGGNGVEKRADGGGEAETEDWNAATLYRVTTNPITSQVAGMLLSGSWNIARTPHPLQVQASAIDSLEPKYECPSSSSLFSLIKSRTSPGAWKSHLDAASSLYKTLDEISGVPEGDEGFHESMDHYYDNLSARQCHSRPLPCNPAPGGKAGKEMCITQEMADNVYRIGHWEYSRGYRDDPRSLDASASSMGVWFAELAGRLEGVKEGTLGAGRGRSRRYFHNIAHDGSISRVLSVMQADEMVWPGMGAEMVFEVWEKKAKTKKGINKEVVEKRVEGSSSNDDDDDDVKRGDKEGEEEEGEGDGEKDKDGLYLRVLYSGKVFKSSSPVLGTVDMLPLDTFLDYVDGLVGKGASLIIDKCSS